MAIRTTRHARFVPLCAALLVATLAIAACGSSSDSKSQSSATTSAGSGAVDSAATPGTALTAGQASRLARILFNNYEDKGASFVADVPFGAGTTFTLSGDVDWTKHEGSATLHTDYQDPAETDTDLQLAWDVNGVYTHLDKPEGQFEWVGSVVDTSVPLHQVLLLIDKVSSTKAENPLLVRQSGATFLRKERVGSVDAEVFRYGDNTTYWVDPKAARMLKVSAQFKSVGNGPVVVTFSRRGAKSITIPDMNTVGQRATSSSLAPVTNTTDAQQTEPTP